VRKDITALEMKPAGGVLKVGTTLQLNLFAVNKTGGTDLVPGNMAAWSSDNNHVGEVNRQGRLTARRAGALTITATYAARTVQAVYTIVD
jgi:Bacterial Ig-like domain (group 2)